MGNPPSSEHPTLSPNLRALKATARLEEGWHVEWGGWAACPYWPLRSGTWFAFSKDKSVFLEAECWAPDAEQDTLILQHLKNECRLRLRMYIYKHLRFREAIDNATSQPDPGS